MLLSLCFCFLLNSVTETGTNNIHSQHLI
jgi:hypothetical protein